MDLTDAGPFEDLLAKYQLMPWWACWACGTSWSGDAAHDCLAALKPDRAFQHLLMVKTLKAFRVRPHEIGSGYVGCSCHSAPFPAGRDYRRRTKHRNRRRR